MTITEFADSRGVDRQTVRVYIKRHPEIRKNTHTEGRQIVLEEDAIALLDRAYPPPKPVTILQGVSHEEHEKLLMRCADLQQQLFRIQTERLEEQKSIAEMSGRMMLLEDKTRRLDEVTAQMEALKEENERLKNRSLLKRILNK